MADILAILTNFRRPDNVPKIVEALASQTVPVDIAIVDQGEHDMPKDAEWSYSIVCGVSNVWDLGDENHGPPCRFAPAFMDHDHEFLFFIDDDILPGKRAVEHLLATCEDVNGCCATIGEIGRIHTPAGEYVRRNIRRYDCSRHVDMTARAHLVRTEYMRHVLTAKWALIERFGDEARRLVSISDDILLSCGIQMCEAYPSYMTAKSDDMETRVRFQDLPDGGGGVSAKPGFLEGRHRLIQMFQSIGWESLV